MRPGGDQLRRWRAVHRWSSLVCTLFLLLLCLTGLPLIFGDEIEAVTEGEHAARPVSSAPARWDLEQLAQRARQRHPGNSVTDMFIDPDEPRIVVTLAPSTGRSEDRENVTFEARTGAELAPPPDHDGYSFMDWMQRLHVDLFLQLPGQLFLCAMGLLFVAAIASGVVIYGPFTRRLAYGAIRTHRSRRLRWLDIHNLTGIATAAWMLVVGLTGAMNELSTPLFNRFLATDVAAAVAASQAQAAPSGTALAPVDRAVAAARRARPDMSVVAITYPGNPFGTKTHYMIWVQGSTPLTRRITFPILADAASGAVTAVVTMPWYGTMIQVSRPLHFGDYGGLPLKILWALLDLVTIAILGSGLYLWFAKGRRERVDAARPAGQGQDAAWEPAR